jgi:hypothetical protein
MKLSLKIKSSNFNTFLQKLHSLSQIDDVVKIKITEDKTLMYSMVSNESAVLALKSYTVKTSDIFENFNKSETFDFIITSAGKFVKNLRFFNTELQIKLELNCKTLPDDVETLQVRSAQFINGKLKISTVGGEQFKIRDLNIAGLDKRLNPKLSKWSFKMSNEDFSNVKKLSSINSEDKIFNITVQNGKVSVSELAKWELEVDEISQKNEQLVFSKKYLSNINDGKEFVYFTVFETFILIKDEDSNLMLSFEQDFSDQD